MKYSLENGMARGSIYKTDVKQARDSLIAQGRHPSLDAVRIALGNTGSKSTIHRLLRELEADEGAPTGQRVGLSDALTELVHRLAEQLQQEADVVVNDAQARFKAEQAKSASALEAQQAESARFSESLRHTEVTLNNERNAHAATQRELADLRLVAAGQVARVDGLVAQLEERDQRITSLEQKHVQAREALEHFRSAAKEQREQELRRHDHALQSVQLELRQAGDSLTAKNHELQQLHRDNGRLLEQNTTSERELISVRNELRVAADRAADMESELTGLRAAAREHAATTIQCERLADQLARAEATLQGEIAAHREVTAERDRLLGRLQGLEDIVKRLEQRSAKRVAQQQSVQLGESSSSDSAATGGSG
jgi:chromosome segregation ATPase